MLSDYTTPAEIRAALGVSATELSDPVLSQTQWGVLAVTDMEDVGLGIPALYITVSALLSGVRTAQQQRFYDLVRLFATYSCAKTLLASLPMFSVSRLSDGRAEFERQSDIFDDVRDGVDATYSAIRQRLSAIYVGLVPGAQIYGAKTFSYTVSTGLLVDPVTNI